MFIIVSDLRLKVQVSEFFCYHSIKRSRCNGVSPINFTSPFLLAFLNLFGTDVLLYIQFHALCAFVPDWDIGEYIKLRRNILY